jgi:hypothetical protein
MRDCTLMICAQPQAGLSEEEQAAGVAAGYEALAPAAMRHEALLAELALPPHERAWLRASAVSAYTFLFTYLRHAAPDSSSAALQARTRSDCVLCAVRLWRSH